MTIISSLDLAALTIILANPLALLHLALAAAHAVPACHYLGRGGERLLAVCYALTATLYLLLALLHGLAH
jgi:hypothetical protein